MKAAAALPFRRRPQPVAPVTSAAHLMRRTWSLGSQRHEPSRACHPARPAIRPFPRAPQLQRFKVEGFSAPLAAAMVPMQHDPPGLANGNGAQTAGNGASSADTDADAPPLAAIAFVADEGFAGKPQGLVLHWCAHWGGASRNALPVLLSM